MSSDIEKIHKIKSLLHLYEKDNAQQVRLESVERNQFYHLKIEKINGNVFGLIIISGSLGSIGNSNLAFVGTAKSCIDKAREIKFQHMEAGFKFILI